MVKQGLGAIVGVPNTGIIAVECGPIFEIPLCDKPIKRPGVQDEVVNVGLLELPELGRGMLAQGIDQAVGVEHKEPFKSGGRRRFLMVGCRVTPLPSPSSHAVYTIMFCWGTQNV